MLQAKKIWKFIAPVNPTDLKRLEEELNSTKNPYFLQLLVSRGIKNFEQAKAFMVPEMENLHDPFLMQDMDAAVDRLSIALEEGEKILIYGDYDVDGTTAVSIMYSYLNEELGADCDYYIPDRYNEGYGVSQAGIEYAKDNGYTLIISLDCGIKAHERVLWCAENGIDFIICDHHLPEKELPKACAVLDPKRTDCGYPFKELTGAGVGYKLLTAFAIAHDLDLAPIHDKLDLLACSIAADMVPMTGENRILAYFGMQKLDQNPRPGLDYLLKKAGRKAPYSVTDVVFSIAPVINAAGRMDHAYGAVKLLLAQSIEEAAEMALPVLNQNIERKAVEKAIVTQALELFSKNSFLQTAHSTVLFYPEWHKGVVGIVASKIQEHYYRPTIILTLSNGHIVGSARSVKGFDIHHALEQCADLLTQFGGHTHAAGLHLEEQQLPAFIKRFDELAQNSLQEKEQKSEITIDLDIPISALSLSFHDKLLNRLAPYGPGNMLPYLVSKVYLQSPPTIMKEDHLKLFLGETPQFRQIEAVAFGMRNAFYEDLLEAYHQQKPFNMAYHLDVNEFNGKRTLQARIVDLSE
ncbi:MAG: Single-stranded-DNA-specific exonuclease RecJ [Bacteroidota bacterium]|jgi:single-stranded-DNA-specific exonuclease